MKFFITICVLWFCLWSCTSPESPKNNVPVSGKQIYFKFCVQCHGKNGDLNLNKASDFTTSTLPLDERIHVITNGRNTMLPYRNQLSAEEIQAVAKYTIELKK